MKRFNFLLTESIVLILILFVYGCEIKNISGQIVQGSKWDDRLNNFSDWGIYRGDKKGNQYSELDQINTENVHLLEPVWEYETRELVSPGMQSNPIVVDGRMYFADPQMNLVALDAATGEELWIFEPNNYHDENITKGQLLKGVVYWEDEDGDNRRIFHFVRDIVFAVDPKTGAIIESFGEKGYIDLKENHVWDAQYLEGQIQVTTPGITYKNYLIIGSKVYEGHTAPPGNIRAFDTLTGEYQWTFHTVPLEGQFGYDTWEWEDDIIYGGANPWAGFTVDEERGWVFAATGSATGGIHGGGTSRKGKNLFANTVLALDATTGERQWHYQAIHHDIWDYDLPPPPMLATINSEGESRDVVVQTGKHPTMLVLDRDTGEPVFPVIDKPVPTEAVPGEEPYPTQPWPLKPEPLVRTSMYESDITDITPESHDAVLEKFSKLKTGPVYTPPSIEGTIITPGIHGGNEWGGPSYDPETNTAYVNVNNIPFILTLIPMKPDQYEDMTAVGRGNVTYNSQCAVCHGTQRQGSPGIPALSDLQLNSDSLRTVVTEGRNYMPAFPSISGEDLDDLITYLESEVDETGTADTTSTSTFKGDGTNFTWSGERDGLEWTTSTPQYVPELNYLTDHMGLPGIKPPWGELVAVDIDKGEIKWKVPLGEYPILVDSLGIDRKTGAENFGGLVTTAGGLIFIAATEDSKFRAFDKSNGELLWDFQMDAPGFASPAVYEIDGKQYVAIVAGGGGKRFRSPVSQPIGRKIHVFSLPD